MNEKKMTGSFYTPPKLVEYMVSLFKDKKISKVMEPSAGDGRFVSALMKLDVKIHAVEIDGSQKDIIETEGSNKAKVTISDFVEFSLKHDEKYDLIIGNPPYINKKNIDKDGRERSKKLVENFQLSESVFQNLWVSFILGSMKLLEKNGSIFFVLPFEFLQVQYAEKLRIFLEKQFDHIEITTFEDRVFENIEQDVCLVLLTNKGDEEVIKYKTLKSIENTEETFSSEIKRNKPLKKWSNCILNDKETETLIDLPKKYNEIRDYGEISPGIVTGANSFFIINKTSSNKMSADKYVLNIISKARYLSNSLFFKKSDFDRLVDDDKEVFLINLNEIKEETVSEKLSEYLAGGVKEGLTKRHKCSSRNRWFDVPIVGKGSAWFFKRYALFPKLVVNESEAYTTDLAYNIRFNKNIDPKSFVFCFFNSLTLTLCEYNGRFYGGGVGELVPSEFKGLSIPYKKISREDIATLDKMFRENKPIFEIIDFVDKKVLNLDDNNKNVLRDIRTRYVKRRII